MPDGEAGGSRPESTELQPITHKPAGLGLWLRSLLGMKAEDHSLKAALHEVLEEHAGDLSDMDAEERRILTNLLNFNEVEVSDIMVPQSEICAIEIDATLDEVRDYMIEDRHTRVPVFADTIDQVKGFVHVKDLIPLLSNPPQNFRVEDILRKTLFVPPSMKVADLLVKMRKAGVHIAMVVDEYGGTRGLVTLEDLFEEIVGEIQDEHDEEEDIAVALQWDEQRCITLEAATRIEQIEQDLGLSLTDPDDEEAYESLGGFVFATLGRVPSKGETLTLPDGLEIEVVDADARRIKTIRLAQPPADAA